MSKTLYNPEQYMDVSSRAWFIYLRAAGIVAIRTVFKGGMTYWSTKKLGNKDDDLPTVRSVSFVFTT